MEHLTDYIRQLQSKSENCFTSDEAQRALGISRQAFNVSLGRLRDKGTIAPLAKNFHIIIGPEFQILGCLPPNYFIDSLMKYKKTPYYVCLLNAAECYGAAHQKPQIYQVMVPKQMSAIRCGKVGVDFIYRKSLKKLPINTFEGPRGPYKISSPELTAMDLLSYVDRVGGLNRVSTILSELVESMDVKRLKGLIKKTGKLSWAQRLGYLLEHVLEITDDARCAELILSLKTYIQQQSPRYVALVQGNIKNKPKNREWHIIINAKIEGDE